MGQLQNEDTLCGSIAKPVSDCSNCVERPNKATVEWAFEERWSVDSGTWSVCGRQPERIQRVNAETTERVDVPRTRRVRTGLSLSVYNKYPSLHEPTCPLPSFLRTLLHSVFAIMLLKRLPDGSKQKRWLPG